MDILSDYGNVVSGGENSNSIERESATTIDGSPSHNDTEALRIFVPCEWN